jgi:hypothetical protein
MAKKPPPGRPARKAPAGSTVTALTAEERLGAYAARRFLGTSLEGKLKLRIPFDVYFQDPQVAKDNPTLAFDADCPVSWEPGLADGPTSARFAVVDYDGHTGTLTPPARWDRKTDRFLAPDGTPLTRSHTKPLQFHQVNVWAILQRALDFFESGQGLGRRLPWGFDGNRLIVVPHAGIGENAYYDRHSKSLQFYYFDRGKDRIYTCLSTDIIHHEFGHAVLDGIRPHLIESVRPETAAFHEFMGDLTAIVIALRNTPFRQALIEETKGDLHKESTLSRVAEQFGTHVKDRPYLRSARNELTMRDLAGDERPHVMSEVLTGAMFDILIRLSKHYVARGRTVPQAFWSTIQRMHYMAIQPLDLLPPVDVTFGDYALAVLRGEEIANPTDPDGYRDMMLDVFIDRGILDTSHREELTTPRHVFDRLDLDVFHDVGAFASSRAGAYRFLDDNRRRLFIPPSADVTVADLYMAHKLTREARRLPRQVILQYLWREDVRLDGSRFGPYDGRATSLLCGATLAMDEQGNVLHWARKPGALPSGDSGEARAEQARGEERRDAFFDALARRINSGAIGRTIGGTTGLLHVAIPPVISHAADGTLRFQLSPHFGIHDDREDVPGSRAWQISS